MAHRPKRLDGSYALMVAGPGIPAGGLEGQFAKKNTDADYDIVWARVSFENLAGLPSDNDALSEVLAQKSDISHVHDTRYYRQEQTYTQSEVNTLLNDKSDVGHTHDDRYYTETEIDDLLAELDEAVYATVGEVNAGTEAAKSVSPDTLAGSKFGKAVFSFAITDPAGSALTTGDGKFYWPVPEVLNGMNLVNVEMGLTTTSSSGIPTFQIANVTQAADMLTTKITVDAGDLHSKDAAAAVAIDAANDDVATGDILRFDCDVAGTGAKGVTITLTFQLP